jgi:hypothetical protein
MFEKRVPNYQVAPGPQILNTTCSERIMLEGATICGRADKPLIGSFLLHGKA